MSSLIEELQSDALNPHVPISNILRKAKVIAVKLGLPDLEKWVENELNGYPTNDIPEYRIVVGQVKYLNLHHGWYPITFPNNEIEQRFSKRRVSQKIAELENLTANCGERELSMSLSAGLKKILMNATGLDEDITIILPASDIVGILDAVRNTLLDWALKLEKSGVLGEGMSFSADERKKAQNVQVVNNYFGTIHTFTGNMGAVGGDVIVKDNIINADSKDAIEFLIGEIRSNEAQLGLSTASLQELSKVLEGLQSEIRSKEPKCDRVRSFLTSIRNILEEAAGSLLAQGILYGLSMLKI